MKAVINKVVLARSYDGDPKGDLLARTTKILAIIAFVFIILALYVVSITPSASGYEFSIYDAYPFWFWLLLIGSIACGLLIMVLHAFRSNENGSSLWVLGFLAIGVTNVILVLLPIFRGYAFSQRTDALTHIGEINRILFYGHIQEVNFYPVMHILSASLLSITGLSIRLIETLIPSFFHIIIYMLSMHLLAREVSYNRTQWLLITAFGSLMIFMSYRHLAPFNLSFSLLPLMLFLWLKSGTSSKYRGLLIVLTVLQVFFHPYGALFFIFVLLCMGLSSWIYRGVQRHWIGAYSVQGVSLVPRIGTINLSLITLVTLFAWFSHFWVFERNVRLIAHSLFKEEVYTKMVELMYGLERAHLSVFEFVDLFMRMHGQWVLYAMLSLILSIIALLGLRSVLEWMKPAHIAFMMIFAVFGMLSVGSIFMLPRAVPFDWQRTAFYAMMAATVLNGLILGTLAEKAKLGPRKPLIAKFMPFVVAVFLIVSSVFSIFNGFSSPRTLDANRQVTQMEVNGWTWLLTYRDNRILIDEIVSEQHRFAELIFYRNADRRKNIRGDAPLVYGERHFNYHQNPLLGQSLEGDRYLLFSKRWKEFLPTVFPDFSDQWALTPDDFRKLERDPSVSKIYLNANVEVFYVHSVP